MLISEKFAGLTSTGCVMQYYFSIYNLKNVNTMETSTYATIFFILDAKSLEY